MAYPQMENVSCRYWCLKDLVEFQLATNSSCSPFVQVSAELVPRSASYGKADPVRCQPVVFFYPSSTQLRHKFGVVRLSRRYYRKPSERREHSRDRRALRKTLFCRLQKDTVSSAIKPRQAIISSGTVIEGDLKEASAMRRVAK